MRQETGTTWRALLRSAVMASGLSAGLAASLGMGGCAAHVPRRVSAAGEAPGLGAESSVVFLPEELERTDGARYAEWETAQRRQWELASRAEASPVESLWPAADRPSLERTGRLYINDRDGREVLYFRGGRGQQGRGGYDFRSRWE